MTSVIVDVTVMFAALLPNTHVYEFWRNMRLLLTNIPFM
jgi:hypothetical protein